MWLEGRSGTLVAIAKLAKIVCLSVGMSVSAAMPVQENSIRIMPRSSAGIVEEVEKINPDLVVRDKDGKVITVRYEAVNAPLLNQFL